MRHLYFLPWCTLTEAYSVGPIELIPYRKRDGLGTDETVAADEVNAVLGMYKDLNGEPITHAALVRYDGATLGTPLSDEDRRTLDDWLHIACFCSLAAREYFGQLPGPNATHFSLHRQEIPDGGDSTHIRLEYSIRGGRVLDARKASELSFGMPRQVSTRMTIRLDKLLASAFEALHDELVPAQSGNWDRWVDAVACYVEAGTEGSFGPGSVVPQRTDHILLSCALERLFAIKNGNGHDLATAFSDALGEYRSLKRTDTERTVKEHKGDDEPWLSYVWMREYYALRGDFAHGRRATAKARGWSPIEHELLATYAFPALVRRLLSDAGHARLGIDHESDLIALEPMMAAPHEGWGKIHHAHRADGPFRRIREVRCAQNALTPPLLAPPQDDEPPA